MLTVAKKFKKQHVPFFLSRSQTVPYRWLHVVFFYRRSTDFCAVQQHRQLQLLSLLTMTRCAVMKMTVHRQAVVPQIQMECLEPNATRVQDSKADA